MYTKTFKQYAYLHTPADLHRLRENDPDNPPNIILTDCSSMDTEGWILLQEFETTLIFQYDAKYTAQALAHLDVIGDKLAEEYYKKQKALSALRSDLLCLPNEVPATASTASDPWDNLGNEDFDEDDDTDDDEEF
jgi:hypothetical protein